MAKPDLYARVEQDLEQGHTYLATTRLRTVLAEDPNDLAARLALAAVYRRTGNLVEAGRWSYLADELAPDELVAFERAHPNPWLRLRMLRFTGDQEQLPVAARARLAELTRQAAQVEPPPWSGPSPTDRRRRRILLPCLLVGLGLPLVAALIAVGLYRVLNAVLSF